MRSYNIILLLLLFKCFPCLGNSPDSVNVTIPFEVESGFLIIKANVNNIPGRFLLDTGAGLCFISTDFYSSINAEICDSIMLNANNTFGKVPVFFLDTISLDNQLNFDSVAATSTKEIDTILKLINVDGIIGSNVFQHFILQFDRQKKEVRLLNKISESYSSKYFVSNIDSNGVVPYIFIGIGDTIKDLPVMFDTGADQFLTMSEDIYKQSIPYNVLEVLMTSYGHNYIGALGLQRADTCHLLIIPTLKVNSVTFKNTRVVSNNTNTTIGAQLLNHGVATVDFINKRFYFEPYKKENKKMKGNPILVNMKKIQKYPSINTVIENKKLVVGIVWDKKFMKRISTGDQIIAIWDKNLEDLDDQEILKVFSNCFTLFQRALITVKKSNGKKAHLFVKIAE